MVESMFKLGVTDSGGVKTKYITRQKLSKFQLSPVRDGPQHDFMMVLSNDTIASIVKQMKREDESDNLASEKTRRFSETALGSFKNNPAYPVLLEFKDTVFRPAGHDGRRTARATRATRTRQAHLVQRHLYCIGILLYDARAKTGYLGFSGIILILKCFLWKLQIGTQ
jgi:hypothetical protein